MENLELQKVANEVRKDIVTALHAAKAGHPGGSLSAADLFTYLYFEEMNIDLIQTEGAATVEAQSNGARGLLETAQVSIANTIELARNVEIPVMTASGLTPTTVALAFAAGASAVGVGSCVNKLNSLLEMTATASAVVSSANRNAVSEEVEVHA